VGLYAAPHSRVLATRYKLGHCACLAWILHEGDTIIPIDAWFFIMLQEEIEVFKNYSLYLNGFLTNLALILAQNLLNHSYGYTLRDFEQASLPY